MRLLALGQAWSDAGGRVEGMLGEAPGAIVRRYEAERFQVRRLPADSTEAADVIAGLLLEDPAARAAIDRPGIGLAELDRLGEASTRILVVDDMALLARYPVALVLNQNAHADRAAYPQTSHSRFLLGLRFVLLRREFREFVANRAIPDRARRLLITFGGADPTGMTARAVDAVLGLPAGTRRDLEVRVVVGAANERANDIGAAAEQAGVAMTVERGVEDMASQMAWADLAVTSGGSTVWELARTGTPALVVETTAAEAMLVLGLGQVGLFELLGAADRLDGAVLRSAIEARIDDRPWRTEMAHRGLQLVDGQGAPRVADALATLDGR